MASYWLFIRMLEIEHRSSGWGDKALYWLSYLPSPQKKIFDRENNESETLRGKWWFGGIQVKCCATVMRALGCGHR